MFEYSVQRGIEIRSTIHLLLKGTLISVPATVRGISHGIWLFISFHLTISRQVQVHLEEGKFADSVKFMPYCSATCQTAIISVVNIVVKVRSFCLLKASQVLYSIKEVDDKHVLNNLQIKRAKNAQAKESESKVCSPP